MKLGYRKYHEQGYYLIVQLPDGLVWQVGHVELSKAEITQRLSGNGVDIKTLTDQKNGDWL
jgi:hypothetical protein